MINQHQMYNDLMSLTSDSNEFFFRDYDLDGHTYRIFGYHLGSYTDFCRDHALECRGSMYRLDPTGPVLVCLPPSKFFNVGENPFTMNLDLSSGLVMVKEDGSLMSTYVHNDDLRLKSKGSLFSEQAIAAQELLDSSKFLRLKEEMHHLEVVHNLTVNLEYVGPTNRIVLDYPDHDLIILNARCNKSGKLLMLDDVKLLGEFPTVERKWVQLFKPDDFIEWYDQIHGMTGTEGFVIQLPTGQLVKVKTDWYVTQHRAKDSINSPRRLYEAVLDEASDDLKGLFFDNQAVIDSITEMEEFVIRLKDDLIKSVDEYFNENKELSRKDFAILGQKTLTKDVFSLVMMKYTGKQIDYTEWLKKHYKTYGISDEEPSQE